MVLVETFSEILRTLTIMVPRLIGMAIILAVGWAIGRGAGELVVRALSKVGAESLNKTAIGKAMVRSGYSVAKVLSIVTKWVIYAAAIFIAIGTLAIQPVTAVAENIVAYIPSFTSGVLILIFGFIFADWAGELVKGAGPTEAGAIYGAVGDITKVFLYFIVLVTALAQMRVDVTLLHIFAWGIAIGIGVAIAFAVGWYVKDLLRPWLQRVTGKAAE